MIPYTTIGSIKAFGRSSAELGLLGGIVTAMAAGILTGCESPYQRDAAEDLRRSVQAAVDREVADMPATGTEQTTVKTAMPLPKEFDARIDELNQLGPKWVNDDARVDLGKGLDGAHRLPVR